MRSTVAGIVSALGLALLMGGSNALAQNLPTIRAATLTLPVLNPIVMTILKAEGFDKTHGFSVELVPYPSIVAMYAGLANGDVDTILGGPTVIQKLSLSGVPLRIVATCVRPTDLVIFSKDSSLQSIADLRGKVLAADMGTQQFQMASIYASSKGVDLVKDVKVANSNFALARTMLEADQADAAMVIEPIATIMRAADPALHTVFAGAAAWKEMTGSEGWELVSVARTDYIAKNPNVAGELVAALQDTATFAMAHPEEADKLAVSSLGLPPGVLETALKNGGFDLEVHPAQQEQDALWDMFKRAVDAGFLPGLPDKSIIYAP